MMTEEGGPAPRGVMFVQSIANCTPSNRFLPQSSQEGLIWTMLALRDELGTDVCFIIELLLYQLFQQNQIRVAQASFNPFEEKEEYYSDDIYGY